MVNTNYAKRLVGANNPGDLEKERSTQSKVEKGPDLASPLYTTWLRQTMQKGFIDANRPQRRGSTNQSPRKDPSTPYVTPSPNYANHTNISHHKHHWPDPIISPQKQRLFVVWFAFVGLRRS